MTTKAVLFISRLEASGRNKAIIFRLCGDSKRASVVRGLAMHTERELAVDDGTHG